MAIVCPHCASPQSFTDAEIGAAGRMAACSLCGTRWLARSLDDDPYRRGVFPRPFPQAVDVSDAIVIEHIGPGFVERPGAASRRPHRRPPPRVPSDRRWLKGLGLALGVVAAFLVLRAPIVEALPQLSASGLPPEVEQLAFQRIRSETVVNRGVNMLLVEGEIVNRSRADVAIPAIRVSLISPDGAEVYSWTVEPAAAGLGPGRSIGFRSAVASPPANASQVTLRLAARENRIVGLR